jgi:thiol:disulfide interchange protein DsbD
MVPVQTPQSPGAAPASIAAAVKYLICREICIPAKAQVSLDLPSTKDSAPHFSASHELFQQTRAQFPKKAPAAWRASASSSKDEFFLTVNGASAPPTTWFLPLDSDIIENSKPQTVEATTQGFRLTLQKSNLLEKPISTLKGVLVFGPGDGYEISVPVVRAK